MHINDSKKELATRVDRHDSLGKGVMNMDLFSFMMNDPRFDNLPHILRSPVESTWAEEIQLLYSLQKTQVSELRSKFRDSDNWITKPNQSIINKSAKSNMTWRFCLKFNCKIR